ncbi:MAG TPA: hypothetical protein VK168_13595 [Saprospiraceae bacterium]|nr:hypothetical protein [Saprospiraceae bacterium]
MSGFTKILLPSLLLIFLASCGEKDKAPLQIPDAYDGAAFAANTTTQMALRSQLEALVTEIKKGRLPGTVVDYNTISQLYNAGTPSLKSITTTYYADRLEGSNGWLNELSKASGNLFTPGASSANGGNFEGYLFEENALELEQMVDKGLYGAALYHHAVTLMQAPVSLATVDQLVCIYGAHADFANTTTAAKAANPDKFLAGYAARRDKNDGLGLYSQAKNALIKLQAAVKAGNDYTQEQEEALAAFRLAWEKANAATVINYCHAVISTLSATNPSDPQKASALHAYSECVGFIHGWRSIPQGYKQITDAEIDQVLTLLNAPYNGTPTSYLFATDPLNELPKLTQVINTLKAEYGFTNQEIEDFKKNWVAEQGR